MEENMSNRAPFERVTVTLPGELLAEVESHRSSLCERVGLDLSRSAAVAQLLRAGLTAEGKSAPSPAS